MAGISIEGVSKRYGAVVAVHRLSLEVQDREFLTLLGPSGCGKTTLLRLIAGFVAPDEGVIRVDGVALSSATAVVPPERRGMGMVFQNYAIWPHKTVYENVAFGLEVRGVRRAEARERVGRVLELVNLAGLEARLPSELSGGQQQRVALARSLIVEPSILLLDEPLSNLDAKLRERMRWELKELQRRTGITFVYVTHDQTEAMALSDRLAVLHGGALLQEGPPRAVYARPASREVADFMGLVNLLSGRVVGSEAGESLVAVAGSRPVVLPVPASLGPGARVQVAIRPESLRLLPEGAGGATTAAGTLRGKIADLTFLGNLLDCHVVLDDGTRVRAQADPGVSLQVGQTVRVLFDPPACTVFESPR
jgi:iron(III) transport system ATP-binding protein